MDWNLYRFDEAPVAEIISTSITFELRPSSVILGETVIVAGSINGVHRVVPMNVYFSKGDSSNPVNISAVTDTNGGFTIKYNPDVLGDWTAVVSYAGDELNSASNSQSETLTVAQPVAASVQFPQSMADLYFVPAVIGIFIAIDIVGAVLCYLLVKKKP